MKEIRTTIAFLNSVILPGEGMTQEVKEAVRKSLIDLKQIEYNLIQSDLMNSRYRQFIETEKLEDDFSEYLELFENRI